MPKSLGFGGAAPAVRRRRSGPGRRRTAEAERNRPGSAYADKDVCAPIRFFYLFVLIK